MGFPAIDYIPSKTGMHEFWGQTMDRLQFLQPKKLESSIVCPQNSSKLVNFFTRYGRLWAASGNSMVVCRNQVTMRMTARIRPKMLDFSWGEQRSRFRRMSPGPARWP